MDSKLAPQIEAKIKLAAQLKTVFSRPAAYDIGIDRVVKIVVKDGTVSGLMLGKDGKLLSFKFNPDKNLAHYQLAENLRSDSDDITEDATEDAIIREDAKKSKECKKGVRCKGACMNKDYICRNNASNIASKPELAKIKATAAKVEGKVDDLEDKSIRELQKIAAEKGVYKANHQKKEQLISNIRVLNTDPESQERLRKTLEKRRANRKAVEKALPKDAVDIWKNLQKLSGTKGKPGVSTTLVVASFLIGATKGKIDQMKANYQQNLGESAQRAYEQAQKIPLQDVKKPNMLFTVGGFAGTGSRADKMKELLEAPQDGTKGEKWFKDGNTIIPVQSAEYDIKTPGVSKKDANGNYNPAYLGSVAKNGFGKMLDTYKKGHNEASVDLAAQLYAYGSKYGDKGINVLAHQVGGNISAEAIDILNKIKPPEGQKGAKGSDIAKRLNLVNLGTPHFGFSDGKAWKDGSIKHRTITSSGDPFSGLPKRAAQWISSVRGGEAEDYLGNADVRERVREAFNYYSSSLSGRRKAEEKAKSRNQAIGEAISVVNPAAGKLWNQLGKLQEKSKESPAAAAVLGGALVASTGIATYKVAKAKHQQRLSISAVKAEEMVDAEMKKIRHRNTNVTFVVGGAGSPSADIIDSLPEDVAGKPGKTGARVGGQTHFVPFDDEIALSVKPADEKDLLVNGYGKMMRDNVGRLMGVGAKENPEAVALAAQLYAQGKRQYEQHGSGGTVNVLAAGTGGNTVREALEILARMGDRDNKRRGQAIAKQVNFVSLGTPNFGMTNDDPGTDRNPKYVPQETNLRGTGDKVARVTTGRMPTAVEVNGSDAKSYLANPAVQERIVREFKYGQRERKAAAKPKNKPAVKPETTQVQKNKATKKTAPTQNPAVFEYGVQKTPPPKSKPSKSKVPAKPPEPKQTSVIFQYGVQQPTTTTPEEPSKPKTSKTKAKKSAAKKPTPGTTLEYGVQPPPKRTRKKKADSTDRADSFESIAKSSKIGKLLPTALYVHVSAINKLPAELKAREQQAAKIAGGRNGAALVKFSLHQPTVSFLVYPDFEKDHHPALAKSFQVNVETSKVAERNYEKSGNRPILHRKETFLDPAHPSHKKFANLTAKEEKAGLYDKETRTIGTAQGWKKRLEEKRAAIKGHSVKIDATQGETEIANATSRAGSKGIVGRTAVVPKLVHKFVSKSEPILDFGAGKDAYFTKTLRKRGYNVTAFEFGENVDPEVHDTKALSRKYKLVFASNVLNVQSSPSMLSETIAQIKKAVAPGGMALVNYPSEPRKIGSMDAEKLKGILGRSFKNIELVAGTNSIPVWKLSN